MRACIGSLLLLFLVAAAAAQTQPPSGAPEQQPASVVTIPPPPEPPPADATAEQLEKSGDQLRIANRPLDALDYYTAALKKAQPPQTAILWNKIGLARWVLGRPKDARKCFEKAIKADPTFADGFNNLGATWYFDKKYGRAVKEYRKAIELREPTALFHANLGTAYFAQKDLPKTVEEIGRALQLDPEVLNRHSRGGTVAQPTNLEDRARFSFVMARMYARIGKVDLALEQLRHAMEDGYKDLAPVYNEADFEAVRKDPRFAELMASKPVAIPQ